MRTYWSNSKGYMNYHIDLKMSPGKVTVYEDSGHWRSEVGGSVTHAEFLSGKYHDLILERFDPEVLQQVIHAVKGLVEQDK